MGTKGFPSRSLTLGRTSMRTVHRIVSLFVVLVTLYLGVTGTVIQMIDLWTLLRHAPATDPNMEAIREDKDGPGDFEVLSTGDYTAAVLPASFNYQAALPQLVGAARSALGAAPLSYAEIRMGESGPIGQVESGRQLLRYDFTTGSTELNQAPPHEGGPPISIRNDFKHVHRMTTFGNWALWINPIVGIALGVFVVTGLVMYWQLLSARKRIKRPQWFWFAGGWWRTLHRWLSIVASVFILVIALSGTWLAVESLVFGFYLTAHLPKPGQPFVRQTGVTPLPDAQVPAMLASTLGAAQLALADQPLKVVRLRVYGGMPQGIIVSGLGDDTQQTAFNAATGRKVSLTEPGYPPTGFPFGWQAHQIAKQVHRGSYIGLSGRWMDLFGGAAILFLSLSGMVMYYNLWQSRRRSGRKALIWTR
jgi:uncharacterized iron-regulated membrane protein